MSTVTHVHGFDAESGVRSLHASTHEGRVIDIALGVIESAISEHTEIVRFNRTWPLDGYGQEWAVVEVNAVTRTTLDGGKTWREMWHWFGIARDPWQIKPEHSRTPAGSTPDLPTTEGEQS